MFQSTLLHVYTFCKSKVMSSCQFEKKNNLRFEFYLVKCSNTLLRKKALSFTLKVVQCRCKSKEEVNLGSSHLRVDLLDSSETGILTRLAAHLGRQRRVASG